LLAVNVSSAEIRSYKRSIEGTRQFTFPPVWNPDNSGDSVLVVHPLRD
jgi:hypothetical protein